MTYHLYKLLDRMMIDSAPHNAPVEESCNASNWLHAKKHFGFEMTPLQIEMLKTRP